MHSIHKVMLGNPTENMPDKELPIDSLLRSAKSVTKDLLRSLERRSKHNPEATGYLKDLEEKIEVITSVENLTRPDDVFPLQMKKAAINLKAELRRNDDAFELQRAAEMFYATHLSIMK